MRSVNCWVAVSGEWARESKVWAICGGLFGESVILTSSIFNWGSKLEGLFEEVAK